MIFNWLHKHVKGKKRASQKGFTVLELIVVMVIFATMSTVVMFNFRGFTQATSLNNLIFDIALEVKTAQTLGSSAIGTDTMGLSLGDINRKSWVITQLEIDGNIMRTYREFDANRGVYSAEGDDELRGEWTLAGGKIDEISICTGIDANSCVFPGTVSIAFMRPRPEPIFMAAGCSGGSAGLDTGLEYCAGRLEILVTDEVDGERSGTVVIEPSGHIYVR